MAADDIVTFRGKRLEDMSHDELIAAVRLLGKMLEDNRRCFHEFLDFHRQTRPAA